MAEDSNSGGYRITLGVVYEAQLKLERQLDALSSEIALVKALAETKDVQAKDSMTRIEKLETKVNSVFVGLGIGIGTALIIYFRGIAG